MNIVNRAVAISLVGRSLSRHQDWLQVSLETTVNAGLLCRQLQPYPTLIRPIICPFTAPRRNLNHNFKAAQDLLSPLIRSRQRHDENPDILQWLIDIWEGTPSQAIPFLTQQILFLATAGIRSTAITIVNVLFDLLTQKQCLKPLRDEIEKSVAEAGGWGFAAIQNMKRLDSFIKESQRMNHHILRKHTCGPNACVDYSWGMLDAIESSIRVLTRVIQLVNFNRKVRRPITLSNGVNLPPGTFLCTPGYWAARDPEKLSRADEFRPWRWLELREGAEQQGKSATPYLASSPNLDNLFWGYGRNACPGRFMAAAEIKLLLAWTLFHFDVSFPQEQGHRPESVFIDERVHPDANQKIGFRLQRDWRATPGSQVGWQNRR